MRISNPCSDGARGERPAPVLSFLPAHPQQDLKAAVIVDVEAIRASRQAEVSAARTMVARTEDRLGIRRERLAADSTYGSAEMLLDSLVNERAIEPHTPVFDKSARADGTFARDDFAYDPETNI